MRLGRVLDIGCGILRNLSHLDGNGVGVDHNVDAVAAVRALGYEYLPHIKAGGRVVFITPQERGYATDATLVWFVGHEETKRLASQAGLTVERQYSFPFPRRAGRIFAYNEFVMVGKVPDTQ